MFNFFFIIFPRSNQACYPPINYSLTFITVGVRVKKKKKNLFLISIKKRRHYTCINTPWEEQSRLYILNYTYQVFQICSSHRDRFFFFKLLGTFFSFDRPITMEKSQFRLFFLARNFARHRHIGTRVSKSNPVKADANGAR